MAVLPDADRKTVWGQFMRQERITAQLAAAVTGLTKAELRAAVDAVDQWVSDNSSAFNTAIPQPARGALTAAQKAALLVYIVLQRYLSGV